MRRTLDAKLSACYARLPCITSPPSCPSAVNSVRSSRARCASGADDRVCQASARLLVDYLGAVSGSDSTNGVSDVDFVIAAKPSVLAPEDLRAAWTDAIGSQLPPCAPHKSALTRVAGLNALDRVNANVAACLESDTETLNALLSMPHRVLTSDLERVPACAPPACHGVGLHGEFTARESRRFRVLSPHRVAR